MPARQRECVEQEVRVSQQLAAALVGGAMMMAAGNSALAHHSFAVFDIQHPLELQGTVKQFRFTSPHTFIILEVKTPDGSIMIWNLEGASPNIMVRNGWTSQSLKSGDEIKVSIDPLRSGAPGGAWTGQKTNFSDGRPVVCCVTDGF
ncbi:MAG TPA: DUF6152 family protein [Xanthobacteraceae bacterium]|jgi:hypothetical protein